MIVTLGRAKLNKSAAQSRELMRLLKDNGYTLSADPKPNTEEYVFDIMSVESRKQKDKSEDE